MRPAMATVQGHEQLSRKSANSGLFNHIVSDGEHPRRDCKAERLCSLQNWRNGPCRGYSITSSANATKFTGNSMPVAFAVLRLITNG